MSTVLDLMLSIREHTAIFYHKDTNQFGYYPVSAKFILEYYHLHHTYLSEVK